MIIEIAGHIGAGKTTLATKITNDLINLGFSVYRTAFAKSLKQLLRSCGIYKYLDVLNKPVDLYFYNLFHSNNKLSINQKYAIWFRYLKDSVVDIYSKVVDINKLEDYLSNIDIFEIKITKLIHKYFIEEDYYTGSRLMLQNIGSLLRSFDEDIFVKYLIYDISNTKADFIIIDDYRFPNEAIDNALKLRIECNNNEIDKEFLYHESEKYISKLDYDILIIRDGEKYDPDYTEILWRILNVYIS